MKKVSWSDNAVQVPGIRPAKYETETAFQIYCVTWLRKQFQLTGKSGFSNWHHSPNEGARSAFKGLEMKLLGTSKGFPDLIHCRAKLALELKMPGKEPSKEQQEWLDYFKSIGWHAEVVFTFDRFKEIVLESVQNLNS